MSFKVVGKGFDKVPHKLLLLLYIYCVSLNTYFKRFGSSEICLRVRLGFLRNISQFKVYKFHI